MLLSAQCTDKRVNEVAPQLWQKLGDTPPDLAAARVDRIENVIRPCGLAPQKARHIKQLSQQLLDEFEGQVPERPG